uniref:DUF4218 domain-containing protein n=1 Tax=Tanacetum cinerariifolium TaxID=118510 RepID=A0A6L2P290_TANCI|nr:hypothetical protein [Tanacetum cinerariifolium]
MSPEILNVTKTDLIKRRRLRSSRGRERAEGRELAESTTEGDIGETSNEPTQAIRNEFEELYVSANKELYPGCDYVTRLDFMAKFTYFKVKGKLTDSIFNEKLKFFQNVFPTTKGYKLPPSYYAIKKTFKMIGLGYESIHACVNDCFLSRGEYHKDKQFCPMCNTSIWKDSNTPGKKVPKKVLHYFLIIPRLQLLYKSSHTAKEMTWHATGKCTEPGKMQHPVDGRAWKNFDTKYLDFAKEPRNIRFRLATDESSFMLTLLIPGPKCLGKDIDVYLRPLIDGLKDLWAKPGVETIDVATGQKFNIRAMVLWTINDFPAQSSLSAWSGRFLKKPHKWRRSHDFNGEIEDGDPPRKFNQDDIMAQLPRLHTHVKDIPKARQDLKRLGIRSGLWLGQNKNKKCTKPQAAYSFTPGDGKKFCQFIKGAKLPGGFGSNFKHKMTDNDTNITGLKSHDCHIMMQRLLPYGLQQYLPADIAKPIIELCLIFKQICSQSLMEDDMLKAHNKVVNIMYNLELIYPPGFFDIMIHLVIYLPLEALDGRPIRLLWMYPFERFMKKLKNYVRNKAKPKVSIAEGYVAEEALTFSSNYFQDVTTKFNRPDLIRIDHQELKKVIWYVLHNSPEIDTYRFKFKSQFANKDMKEEFLGWFGSQIRQRHVDKDPGVSASIELFALACGPTLNPISVNSCVVIGVRFVVHGRDERRTTQNSSICSPGEEGEMYYDIIDIYEYDDIINDEDVLPYDLADSDDEDLVNVDDDDGMSADVARGHGDNGGSDDRLPPHQLAGGCRGKGTRKSNLGGRKASRMNTHKETRNLGLRKIMDELGPQPIWFEWKDSGMIFPLGEHSSHWANLLGEIMMEFPMHFGSWRSIPSEQKVGVLRKIRTQFDLKPHMQSELWPEIKKSIDQHLGKIYTENKSSLKRDYWKIGMSISGFGQILRTWPGTYTYDQITAMVREGKQRWHIPDVGRVLAGRGKDVLDVPVPRCNHTFDVNELKRSSKQLQKQIDMITKAMSSDDSDMSSGNTIPGDIAGENGFMSSR